MAREREAIFEVGLESTEVEWKCNRRYRRWDLGLSSS